MSDNLVNFGVTKKPAPGEGETPTEHSADIVEPPFHGSKLIASLEDALERAKNGDLVSCVFIGVLRDGEYTLGGCSGDTERMPTMALIGELEFQKQQLLNSVEHDDKG